MALDLRVVVRKSLADLQKEISRKNSELATLKNQLARYQQVEQLIKGEPGPGRTKPSGTAKQKQVDWDSVLDRLPGSFPVGKVASVANKKPSPYMHRVLANWIKQRKVKRVERGRYQKV